MQVKIKVHHLQIQEKSNDKYCNIFDMSGNAYEWTTEYSAKSVDSDFCPCVPRGGLRYSGWL